MTGILVFLLLAILLVLCKPLRTALGVVVWIFIGLLWWHWPSDEDMKARARVESPSPAVIERAEPVPPVRRNPGIVEYDFDVRPDLPRSPNELDFRPVYRPDGKPGKRIQH